MPCHHVNLPNGARAIVCTPKVRKKKCYYCSKPAPYLCDHKAGGARCDRPICNDHAVAKGDNIDWCRKHLEEPQGVLSF
jgi:hypothetical protein